MTLSHPPEPTGASGSPAHRGNCAPSSRRTSRTSTCTVIVMVGAPITFLGRVPSAAHVVVRANDHNLCGPWRQRPQTAVADSSGLGGPDAGGDGARDHL